MKPKIYLASPHMSDEGYEQMFINEAFETNWIAPLGNNVTEFENSIASLVSSKYAVALSSGTAAIHLALKAANVGKDDIVFCQSLTFAASSFPILYQNATPVFIDSNKETWNMDPDLLEKAFEKYPEAKAVIVVHLYGLPADMDRISEICKKHHTVLIEDAAESLGSTYKGKYTGTFGDYGTFSFNGNKIITTSGGGVIVSDHDLSRVRFWSTQSKENFRYYHHLEIGYNYRLSNVLAGIGRGQLKVLAQRIRKKQYILEYYKKALASIPDIEFMPHFPSTDPNCWLSCIQLKGKIRPMDIILALENDNIESRPIWKPMQLQPVFSQYDYIGSDVSKEIFENGVCLPSDTKMSDSDLERICNIIKGLWKK